MAHDANNVNHPRFSRERSVCYYILFREEWALYMKLMVDKATVDYIKGKGRIINIDLYTPKSCCGGIAEPVVNFGDPKLIQQFDEYFIDDIKIYVTYYYLNLD